MAAITLLASGCSSITKKAAPKGEQKDVFIANGKSTVTMPFELIDNRIFIDGYLNGKGPFRFILDTGAGEGVLVTPAVATAAGIQGGKPFEENGAGAGTEAGESTFVSEVKFSDIQLVHQKAEILSLEKLKRAIGFSRLDGIVGYSLFRDFVVEIDYEQSTVSFSLPSATRPPTLGGVPLEITRQTPYVSVSFGGAKGRFILDLGDRSSFSISSPFSKRNGLLEKYHPKIELITGWGIGGPIPAWVTRVPELSLGHIRVKDVVTRFPTLKAGVFASKDVDGLVGTGILKKFRVILDYPNQWMTLEPTSHLGDADPVDRSGLWLGLGDDGFAVMDVAKGTPAAEKGLKIGDSIIGVGGRPASTLSLPDVRDQMKDTRRRTIDLRVRSNGHDRDVRIRLRDYI